MKHRTCRIILCLVILLSVPAVLAGAAFGLPSQYRRTYLAALQDKWNRLAETTGPRIVVARGSGVCFDLRSDLLEEELPEYHVINFGLYAGLGTTVMTDLALPQLSEGDVLIFCPEPTPQTLSTYFDAASFWQAADGSLSLLTALPREYIEPILGAFPEFAASKARFFLENSAPAGDGIYARSSLNAYGDITSAGRECNRMPNGYDPNMLLSFDPEMPT